MPDAVIAADLRISRQRGFSLAVDNLALPAGEVHAFVGHNGSGKSTFLEAVLGLIDPDSGSIRVFGRSVAELQSRASLRRRLGAQIQGATWSPRVRVDEILAIHRTHYRSWSDECAQALGIGELMKLTYRQLSTGQKRRVDLAVALAHRPELAVLDEPTSGLDPNFAHNLTGLIRSLRAVGSTLLIATHNGAELGNADNVVWLKSGRVKATGGLRSLLSNALGEVAVALVVDEPQSVASQIKQQASSVEVADNRVIAYGGSALRRFALSDAAQLEPTELPAEFAPSADNPQVLTLRLKAQPDANSGSMTSMVEAAVADLNVELAGGRPIVALRYLIGSDEDASPGYSQSTYYVIGLSVLTIVSTALFGFTGPLIALRAEGGLKLFQAMPIHRVAFTLGYAGCRVLILLLFAFLYICIGLWVYGAGQSVSPGNWPLLMFLVALSSVAFLSLGMAVAGVVTKISTANALINLVNIPIMFLSDLFIPISLMPESIQLVAGYSPIYMLADAMRQVAAGTAGLAECWPTILYLIALAAIGAVVAAFSFRWNVRA